MASDVSARDGLGWEFTSRYGGGFWEVFRDDSGPFPVFSSVRGTGDLASSQDLTAMTAEAVTDLLASAGHPDEAGWISRNITAALLMASREIVSWEGVEWALDTDGGGEPTVWAGPADGRTPFAWLRARGRGWDAVVDIYQDDALFGLTFISPWDRQLPVLDEGSWRTRRNLPLVTGPFTRWRSSSTRRQKAVTISGLSPRCCCTARPIPRFSLPPRRTRPVSGTCSMNPWSPSPARMSPMRWNGFPNVNGGALPWDTVRDAFPPFHSPRFLG